MEVEAMALEWRCVRCSTRWYGSALQVPLWCPHCLGAVLRADLVVGVRP